MRPSSLDALAVCPCFEPGTSDYADEGSERHEALKAALEGNTMPLDALPDDDRDGVAWAIEYIRTHADVSPENPLILERKTSALFSGFTEIRGTPDVVCHLDIFDLKWRPRTYDAQMACYAAARLEELNLSGSVRVHLAETSRAGHGNDLCEQDRVEEQTQIGSAAVVPIAQGDVADSGRPVDARIREEAAMSAAQIQKLLEAHDPAGVVRSHIEDLERTIEAARTVRRLQRQYFATRSKEALRLSMAAEKNLDRMLEVR